MDTQENVVESTIKNMQRPLLVNPADESVKGFRYPFAFVPEPDGGMSVFDLSSYAPPRRRDVKGVVDMASFLAYAKRFTTPEMQVFAKRKEGTVSATFDYLPATEEAKAAQIGADKEHVLQLKLGYSEQYARWKKLLGSPIPQMDFAEFLDQYFRDVVAPSAAELKEVALTLEASASHTFKSTKRLKDGAGEHVWKVEMQTNAGHNGELEVPERISIRVPLWEGAEPIILDLRFRIRIRDGAAVFILLPDDWEGLEQDAWRRVCETIATELEVAVYQQ